MWTSAADKLYQEDLGSLGLAESVVATSVLYIKS